MKKSILYIVACFVLSYFNTSCNTSDDLYIDPSTPEKGTAPTVLTALEANTFMNLTGDLARVTSILCEQMAGCGAQYTDLQNYDILGGDYNNHWGALYSGTMYNAKLLIEEYSIDRPHYAGVAKVLMAINLGVATDLWGDVPYSDAFGAVKGNETALFDAQKDVLDSIQSLLDQAITDLTSEGENVQLIGTDDLIYGGDIEQWINTAWILKARYANRLSLKDPQGSANKVLEYLSNISITIKDPEGIIPTTTIKDISVYQNMESQYSASNPNQWAAYQNQRGGTMVANKVFVDMLKTNNDPRLPYFFAKNEESTIIGADINERVVNSSASIVNILKAGEYIYDEEEDEDGNTIKILVMASDVNGYFRSNSNSPIVTTIEAYFLKAEAQNRLGQNATDALNDGIKASVNYVTKGANNGSSIATYTSASISDIMTEKWKAMFGQIEAYNDFRRIGIPTLNPRPEAAGAIRDYIPQRLPIPQNERVANPNAIYIELNVPVWWAQP